jgi:chromosome partitioning protein
MAHTEPPDRDQTLTACTFIDKGGVGKTTTTAHLGVALARADEDVLLIDLAGKQGDLAKQFGLTDELEAHDDWPNISTVFQPVWGDIVAKYRERFDQDPVDELIFETGEGPDLIPAHHGLDSLEVELDNKFSDARKFTRLESFLEEHIYSRYSAVLIDLPGVANNVAYNGIFATENVITPVQAGSFESQQADALERDLQTIRENYDRPVELTMLVPNMIDTRTKLATRYLQEYAERFGDALAPEAIPNSQDISNAQDEGRTIFALEELSKTARRALRAYEENARVLRERVLGGDSVGHTEVEA